MTRNQLNILYENIYQRITESLKVLFEGKLLKLAVKTQETSLKQRYKC